MNFVGAATMLRSRSCVGPATLPPCSNWGRIGAEARRPQVTSPELFSPVILTITGARLTSRDFRAASVTTIAALSFAGSDSLS
jgi:hypothetical protein